MSATGLPARPKERRVTTDALATHRPGDGAGRAPVTDRLCALTVDVEDWYQSCFDREAPISERVVRNVHRMLGILDDADVKATFFVQGLVAEAYPGTDRGDGRRGP